MTFFDKLDGPCLKEIYDRIDEYSARKAFASASGIPFLYELLVEDLEILTEKHLDISSRYDELTENEMEDQIFFNRDKFQKYLCVYESGELEYSMLINACFHDFEEAAIKIMKTYDHYCDPFGTIYTRTSLRHNRYKRYSAFSVALERRLNKVVYYLYKMFKNTHDGCVHDVRCLFFQQKEHETLFMKTIKAGYEDIALDMITNYPKECCIDYSHKDSTALSIAENMGFRQLSDTIKSNKESQNVE